MSRALAVVLFFFFNDTATTEIYTLSLHDALPICALLNSQPMGFYSPRLLLNEARRIGLGVLPPDANVSEGDLDRKSTRLNSSHANISYAVFCLKKKKTKV